MLTRSGRYVRMTTEYLRGYNFFSKNFQPQKSGSWISIEYFLHLNEKARC